MEMMWHRRSTTFDISYHRDALSSREGLIYSPRMMC